MFRAHFADDLQTQAVHNQNCAVTYDQILAPSIIEVYCRGLMFFQT